MTSAPAQALTDTLWEVETPEGIMLHLRPAGFAPRGIAWLIDFGIRMLVNLVLSIPAYLVLGNVAGTGLMLVVGFLMEWLYPVIFEVMRGGQTPGKKICHLRVLHDNGTPVGWPASLVRNLLRVIDFLIFYAAAAVTMLTDSRNRRLGDLAAGTIVVHSDPEKPPRLGGTLAGEAPNQSLSLEERASIVAFAERLGDLSEARRIELAELLRPLHGRSGGEAVTTLRRNAAHFRGDS